MEGGECYVSLTSFPRIDRFGAVGAIASFLKRLNPHQVGDRCSVADFAGATDVPRFRLRK